MQISTFAEQRARVYKYLNNKYLHIYSNHAGNVRSTSRAAHLFGIAEVSHHLRGGALYEHDHARADDDDPEQSCQSAGRQDRARYSQQRSVTGEPATSVPHTHNRGPIYKIPYDLS